MSRTKVIIGYLSPLLSLEDPVLENFITRWANLDEFILKGNVII